MNKCISIPRTIVNIIILNHDKPKHISLYYNNATKREIPDHCTNDRFQEL